MDTKYIGGIIAILILIAGGWYAFSMNKGPDAAMQEANSETTPTTASTTENGGTGVDVGVTTGTVKEVVVEGNNFAFSPAEIRVAEGTRVKVIFNNTGGNHDFVIDEFNARTKVIKGGETETIEFVANKKGTFEYYCSVGTHRQMGMKGNLIVE